MGLDKPSIFITEWTAYHWPKRMLIHIPLYQMSLNPKAFFRSFIFQSQFPQCNIIYKCCPDLHVMIKINTLMVCFCFEIWIYYKWTPDKQTHAWPPLNVLRGLQSLDRNNTTVIMKENSKSSACHVLFPYPSAWKDCFRMGGEKYTYPWIWHGIIYLNPPYPNPAVTCKQCTAHVT